VALRPKNHPTSPTVTVGNSKNIWFGNIVSGYCCQKIEYSAADLKNGKNAKIVGLQTKWDKILVVLS
jgi:hypothetical protein